MKKKPGASKRKIFIKRNFISHHKFLIIILAVIAVVVGVFVADLITQTYERWQNEKNIKTMTDTMESIQKKLSEKVPTISWSNESHCSIIKPRLFGDATQYMCTSQYTSSAVVDNQSDIDGIISSHQEILRNESRLYAVDEILSYPTYTTDSLALHKSIEKDHNYTEGVGFLIRGVMKRGGKCAIIYELLQDSSMKTVLSSRFECTIDTDKVYFEPVRMV